ncbi:hypothetical protein [Curtobacterium sp. MCJR17_020]|uniref:hypothetical protein n=1 Tax=Curtobacterium sp. MCJR17_020 TaxID=2175619 RepID=UPI0015E8BFFF|nr:hypothetical protein [Curtobacterium sp. MCJR17_020]WIE72754.1 hypothetical protein DEJ14_003005 [Curtobacterium sp. MCJR17_020]
MTTLLFLVVAVILLSIAVGLVRMHPRIVYWVVSLYAVTAWEYPNFGTIGTFGGTTITLGDGLAVALVVAGVLDARTALRRFRPPALIAGALVIVLLAAALARGIEEYGLGAAVNESRAFLYVLGILFWGVTRPWPTGEIAYAQKFFVVVQGVGLCVVATYHVIRYGLGGTADFVLVNGELNQTGRPLVSGQALLLTLCAILALRVWHQGGQTRYLTLSGLFVVFVLISQQRTVWATAIVLALLLLARGPRSLRTKLVALVGVCLVGGVLVVAAQSSMSSVIDEFAGSASNTGTYSARLTSWLGLIAESVQEGPLTVLFGAPFGHGYARFEGVGRWVVFAPHNWYVTVYLREGLLGLGAMLVIFLPRVVAGLRSHRDVFLECILVCFLLYGWTYSWQWWTCLPLALAFLDRAFPALAEPVSVPATASRRLQEVR